MHGTAPRIGRIEGAGKRDAQNRFRKVRAVGKLETSCHVGQRGTAQHPGLEQFGQQDANHRIKGARFEIILHSGGIARAQAESTRQLTCAK